MNHSSIRRRIAPAFSPAATLVLTALVVALPSFGLAAVVGGGGAAGITVKRFSPQGHVKAPQQVTATFSAAMVPFGDLRDVAPPFEIDCPAKGTSRWIDSQTWAYDFANPLPAGMTCKFTPRRDLRTHGGMAVAASRPFTFDTGGPAVVSTTPPAGAGTVDEQQVFFLDLDGAVDVASVREYAGFVVEGLRERIEADVVEGVELDALVASMNRWSRPTPPFVALKARRAFPNGKGVVLHWGAGIRSTSGVATLQSTTLPFTVRPEFSASTSCRRENAQYGCLPIRPITVEFSSPVPNDKAWQLRLVGPDGAEKVPTPPDEDEQADGFTQRIDFPAPFADSTTFTIRMPADLRDDAGRALPAEQAAKLTVKTGPPPVLAKFASRFGILERNAEPALPVTLRNVESLLAATGALPTAPATVSALGSVLATVTGTDFRVGRDDSKQILTWLRRVAVAGRARSLFDPAAPGAAQGAGAAPGSAADTERREFTVPNATTKAESEVVGIALDKPGLHIVELSSPLLGAALLGNSKKMYVSAAALVTNLAVHFKRGRESSIAWVTTLDEAKPVEGARVVVSDCAGVELAAAHTDENGVARFGALKESVENWSPACRLDAVPDESDPSNHSEAYSSPALSGLSGGLLVVARTTDDMSFVHTSWDRGIESWRFDLPSAEWWGPGPSSHATSHTIFDRSLFREGETVHMKHVLRDKVLAGFAMPAENQRPTLSAIEHLGSGTRHELPVSFDASGVATLDWTIPPGAKLGSYQVSLRHEENWISSGSFRVEQFRVPLMRGELGVAAVLEPKTSTVNVDVSVRHLSGGPAAALPVVLRSELRPGYFSAPDDYDGYTFAAGPVREGFENDQEEEEVESAGDTVAKAHHREEFALDAAGTRRAVVGNLPAVERPTDLVLEIEYRDPNGETQTVATTRTLLPSARIPGIRVDDWTSARETLTPRVVVLSPDGKPVADIAVKIEASRRQSFTHRKRLVGGFYGYVHTSEVKKLGPLCEGRTDARGLFTCSAPPPARGELILQASVADPAGGEAHTQTEVWVSGEDSGFDSRPSDRIDLVPEKPTYAPGETARLQVRMPFREATALVTIEREGVGEARVVQVTSENPVVEVAIRDDYAPNVFVSALLVRGRVSDVQPTALVDLGRPAYKLGIAEVGVQAGGHRLDVAVRSDRDVYRVRDKARVHVAVRTADGKAPAPGSEVAIAAVDEGLLDLAPNPSWDLLDAMMGRRACEVETSTAQGEVIGKRHYGKKGVTAGGGGGRSATRELFDTLLLWAPRVKLDAGGNADVEVPLNDSLTAFRIVAVATSGAGRFGTGHATIRATRELSMQSGLPPLVREGDRFTAEFTLHNTSEGPLDVRASGEVEGLAAPLPEQKVTLAPGEGRVVTWPVLVPAGRGELVYTMAATTPTFDDSLRVRQRVVAAERVQVTQSTLEQVDGSRNFPVRLPAGADGSAAGSGITVAASASLSGSVDSVKDWLARYPYTCLEQRVSMAIGREDDKAWQGIVDGIESYIDPSGLLRYFPGSLPGDDTLTAYVLSISLAAGRAFPEDVTARLIDGLRGFVSGTVAASRGPIVPDYALRKLAAIAALARAGKAEPEMLASISIQPALWPTSAVLDWWTIALALPIGERDAKRKEVDQVMRSRVDLSGTTLSFRGAQWQDNLWWMMASVDSDAARLLLLLADKSLWKEDAPRVLRGLIARREGGAWQTTVANAWGVVAMRAFAKNFEGESVTGRTDVALADAKRTVEWTTPIPPPAVLPWPESEAGLSVVHDGTGKPWITTTARAAVALTEPVAAGYRLRKTVTPVEAGKGNPWRRADRVKVRLDIDAQREMWWVAVDDPIPAGASHLGSGLGRGLGHGLGSGLGHGLGSGDLAGTMPGSGECRGSDADCDDEDSEPLHPAYVERSQESWRAYVQHVPAGHSYVEYSIRLNQAGTFHLPATRVEALYAPEIFGQLPNAIVKVEP